MELTYTLVGDYYLPNLTLRDPPDAPTLGWYGKQRDDVIALKLARQNVDIFLSGAREKKLLERGYSREREAL